jgi:ATP-dependent DNA helicase PIF1
MPLNELQQVAFDAFFRRENLFIAGSAGTGKSYVLMQIHKHALQLRSPKLGLTATTGSASHLVGGRTIHSFLGIGLGRGTALQLANNVMTKNKQCVKKLKALDALLIEEVSMLDDELFDKISDYLSIIRKNPKPFGGLQLIVLGDFCQLPPVKGDYCFKSSVWRSMGFTTVRLTKLVRQHDDPDFQEILEKVRWGKCDEPMLKTFKSWMRASHGQGQGQGQSGDCSNSGNNIKPTRLYPTNANVDAINDDEYEQLVSDDSISRQTYDTTYGSPAAKMWAKSSKVPEQIKLCVDAQVVVTWNVNQAIGIVNGSRGCITALDASGVTIQDVRGRYIKIEPVTISDNNLTVSYMPLKLAYALTIHRCQGMTLDSVEIDLGSTIFEYGQAYTALSRARNSQSVRLVDVEAASFKCHPDVIAFYESLQ